jgi:transposase InsO family protein
VQRSDKGSTRYIYTAVDKYSKVAFAHAYTRHSSRAARDFLYRLHYLLDGRITNIQTDNGSEFEGHFAQGLKDLGIEHYYSRVRTPKDNGSNERFNRTLSEECLQMGNMTENLELLNRRLTDWLVEYNFHRPHQALGYESPMNYHYRKQKVLPMYPSST